jgi:hypothetical protein
MTIRKISGTVTLLAVATLALTLWIPGASAQTKLFKFQIPFDFYAGEQSMPAGTYTVAYNPLGRTTQIYDDSGHVKTMLPIPTVRNPIGNNRMVFNRYGTVNFLSEIQWADSSMGLRVRESSLEREAKLNNASIKVAVQPR